MRKMAATTIGTEYPCVRVVNQTNRGWPDRRTDIEEAIDPTIGGPEG